MLFGMALLFGATGSVMFADFVDPSLASNRSVLDGRGHVLDRARVQAEPRAVSHLDAGRLRRRAAAGYGVHECRHQSRRLWRCSRASSTPRLPSGVSANLLLPDLDRRGTLDDRRQRGRCWRSPTSNGCWRTRVSRRSGTSSRRSPARTPLGLRYALYYLGSVHVHESRCVRGRRGALATTANKVRA